MQQPMPVVRQVYWPGLIPQFIGIAMFALLSRIWFRSATVGQAVVLGAAGYLVMCRLLRALLVRDHTRGMTACRAGRFEEAIRHFQASYEFFNAHRRLDAWRSLLFGVASYNPYRVIALGNMAWCYGQLGNRDKAIELYEQVLNEMPDHTAARAALNILRPGTGPAKAG